MRIRCFAFVGKKKKKKISQAENNNNNNMTTGTTVTGKRTRDTDFKEARR